MGPMAQFDPRRQPMRLAPHVATAAAAISVALLAGRVYQPAQAEEVPVLSSAQMAAMEAQAFAAEQEQAQTWNASAGEAAPKEQPYSDPNAMAGFEQAPAATGFAAPAAPEQQWDPNAQAAPAAQQWGA